LKVKERTFGPLALQADICESDGAASRDGLLGDAAAVTSGPAEIGPLLLPKRHHERSVFTAANLLREARRQRGRAEVAVPAVCILDPDGDLTRYLHTTGLATTDESWACYHTQLSRFALGEHALGIVPFTVGAPFAVLVAEELAASGCRLVINLTSAGRIAAPTGLAAFVVIEQALRDEGTSLHYLPASRWSRLSSDIRDRLADLVVPAPRRRSCMAARGRPMRRSARRSTTSPSIAP
jgi:hypothetical protein